jgi:hypothetical protein
MVKGLADRSPKTVFEETGNSRELSPILESIFSGLKSKMDTLPHLNVFYNLTNL